MHLCSAREDRSHARHRRGVRASSGDRSRSSSTAAGSPFFTRETPWALPDRRVALPQSLDRVERVVVVDPGCAMTLRQHYVDVATLRPAVDLLVDLAADDLARFTPAPIAGPVRYHDPCQLGRGLGVYEAPRRVLGRALGRSAEEFPAQGEAAVCSGRPAASSLSRCRTRRERSRTRGWTSIGVRAVAKSSRHARRACSRFRRASARLASPAPVSDLVTWISNT